MPNWDIRFDLNIDLTAYELIAAVARSEALAYIVRGIPMPPAVHARLDRLNISRAVRGTTGIEGSDLSEAEVAQVLDSNAENVLGRGRVREEREARNAANVMRFVEATLDADPDRPLGEELIREIHRLTTEDIDYAHNTPGAYRSHGVTAGEYAPPAPDTVPALMTEFVHWLNGVALRLPPAIRAIAAHFYFISIHPFGDGNGRTARALESYLLYQGKLNVVGFYSLSNFYYRRRADYIEMLDYVRFQSGGNLTPFIQFALNGLVEELEQVRQEVVRAVTEILYLDYAVSLLAHELLEPAARRMEALIVNLGEPIPERDLRQKKHWLSSLYNNLSSRTLSRDLRFLEEKKLIRRERGLILRNLEVMTQFTR